MWNRKRDDSKKIDVSLLCLLAEIAVMGNKDLLNQVLDNLLSLISHKNHKRIALLILVLTKNCEQKDEPSKSDLKAAKLFINWAKANRAEMQKRRIIKKEVTP